LLGLHFLNLAPVNFEAYLTSKKIDSAALKKADPVLWESWQKEFELLHPNSFTAQKLYLINPLRRKFQLKDAIVETAEVPSGTTASAPAAKPKPMMRPKPKIG
jgi:hypothetical protein